MPRSSESRIQAGFAFPSPHSTRRQWRVTSPSAQLQRQQRMLHKEKSSHGIKSLQQHGDGKGSKGCPTSVRGLLCPSVSPSQVFGWQLHSHGDSRGLEGQPRDFRRTRPFSMAEYAHSMSITVTVLSFSEDPETLRVGLKRH